MALRVAVAGAGAWGSALGAVAAARGEPVLVWAREAAVAADINQNGRNQAFLPGIILPPSLRATTQLEALGDADAVLLATPAQHLRAIAGALAPALKPDVILVICAKGIEQGTRALMGEVLAEVAPRAITAVLSGPSFAHEVARGLPTAVTLAIADAQRGAALAARLGQSTFRPYLSDDLIGAQIGGAVKNVLAIACGIVEGRALGQSARAALITRGFAEMTRIALRRGARLETLAGLSGFGDLVLTCTSPASRNYALGLKLALGERPATLREGESSIAEGAFTARSLVELAAAHGVEMPISAAVDAILTDRLAIDAAIDALLTRPLTSER